MGRESYMFTETEHLSNRACELFVKGEVGAEPRKLSHEAPQLIFTNYLTTNRDSFEVNDIKSPTLDIGF